MKLLIIMIAVLSIAAVPLEDGAVFNGDGTCTEADGTQCVTPADYDVMFSYENLSSVLTQYPFDGDTTVAEQYNIEPGIASERPRIFQGEPRSSFAQSVRLAFRIMPR